jgi:hypothetical protein
VARGAVVGVHGGNGVLKWPVVARDRDLTVEAAMATAARLRHARARASSAHFIGRGGAQRFDTKEPAVRGGGGPAGLVAEATATRGRVRRDYVLPRCMLGGEGVRVRMGPGAHSWVLSRTCACLTASASGLRGQPQRVCHSLV